jgi:hypothetical protein
VRGLAVLAFFPFVAWAHEPITTKITWSREVSRLVYSRCAGCHSDTSSLPLMTYEQARPWAKAIKDEVLNRRMPPWGAVKGYGEFKYDPSLTQEQIGLIAQWVEGGAPEGDPKLMPPRPGADKTKPLTGHRQPLPEVVRTPFRLAALEPQASVSDLRISAVFPDGRIEPLIRLHDYNAAWRITYVLAAPLALPRGTKLVFDPAPIPMQAVTADR